MYGKLYFQKKMKLTYLIQRLCKPIGHPNPFAFGEAGLRNGGLSDEAMAQLKGIFSFDYMGAAEFEWGAVPAALKFIAEQASKRTPLFSKKDCVTSGVHSGVYYICPRPYEEGVKTIITTLLENERSLDLKEYCGLAERVKDPQGYKKENVGWLELDNGFFFFTDVEMYEKTKLLFGVK